MQRIMKKIVAAAVISLLSIAWINNSLFAQDATNGNTIRQQLNNMGIEIPFVDKDGDGINDLLQNGWGLRFLERYRNRTALWNQMNADGEMGNKMIDTNGDGTPDTPLNEFMHKQMNTLIDTDGDGAPDTPLREVMKNQMNSLVDTDGDGTPDTPLKDYMRKQFQVCDLDGDGIPDELTSEQIRNQLQLMRQWRKQIRQNLLNGLPGFTDEDGDGIPDNLPDIFRRMLQRRNGKNN